MSPDSHVDTLLSVIRLHPSVGGCFATAAPSCVGCVVVPVVEQLLHLKQACVTVELSSLPGLL